MKHPFLILSLIGSIAIPATALAQTQTPVMSPPAPVAQSATLPEDPGVTARAKMWFDRMRNADFDRSQMIFEIADSFTQDQVKAIAEQIEPLGEPTTFAYGSAVAGDQYTVYQYDLTFGNGDRLCYLLSLDRSGKITQLHLQQMT